MRSGRASGTSLWIGRHVAQTRRARAANKNTMDLQWKIAANYNVRPCKGKRNAARARTLGNNGKNNAKNNGNNRKSGRLSTSGCSTGRLTAALRARRGQVDRAG